MIDLPANQTLDALLHQVLNHALVTIGAEGGSLMLADHVQGILQIKVRLGIPREGRTSEPVFKIGGDSIAGSVADTLESYNCPDIEEDSHFEPSRSGLNFRSLLSVPIVYENRAIAVINADAREPGRFSERDLNRLEDVAAHVAEPIADKISILDALLEIGKDLSRLPREGGVEIVLQKIADAAVRSLGADIVTVYQYDQSRDEFLVEGTGPTIGGVLVDNAPMRTKVYPGDVPFTIVRSRESGFHPEVNKFNFLTGEVDRPGADPRPRFIDREGIKSMAALLLPYSAAQTEKDEEVVGVMFANYRTKHDFNIDEIKALGTFADFAAVAILNARNEERRVRENIDVANAVSGSLIHRMSRLFAASKLAVDNLLQRFGDDKKACGQLNLIQRQSKLLFGLAKRLSARIKDTGRPTEIQPIKLHTIVAAVLETFDLEIEQSEIKVENHVTEAVPAVETDAFHLQQVVNDLLRNAIESIREKSAEKEAAGETFFGNFKLIPIENVEKKSIDLQIIDNGQGIDEEKHEKVFLPGVTSKETLGIGLWWCRTFVKATGGELYLDSSQPGEGCTFVLRIPLLDSTRQDSDPSQINGSPHLLMVDDDAEFAEQLGDSLTGIECELDTASTLEEAKRKVSRNRYTVVILDISLSDTGGEPDQQGLELLPFLNDHQSETKVILVTGHGETIDVDRIVKDQPRVVKAFDKETMETSRFRETVQSILDLHTA